MRVVSFLGNVLPFHCTAAGKVYLVFEPEGAPGQNLPDRLERYTDGTIVDRNALREQMKMIGESGYAIERGEFAEDVNAVAVPIRDYTRSLVGALAVVGPAHRFSNDAVNNEIAPVLLKALAAVRSRALRDQVVTAESALSPLSPVDGRSGAPSPHRDRMGGWIAESGAARGHA